MSHKHRPTPESPSRRQREDRLNVGQLIGEYLDQPTVEDKIQLADRLSTSSVLYLLSIVAEMYADTAADPSLDVIKKQDLLERSQKTWQNIETRSSTNHIDLCSFAGNAAVRLALHPSRRWLIVGERIPPLDQTKEDYANLLLRTSNIATNIRTTNSEHQRGVLIGTRSEVAVQALLMRFAINNEFDDYAPMLSRLSEDCGDIPQNRWDISVFIPDTPTNPLKIAHKIQVKTSAHGYDEGVEYADHIDVVHVQDDLSMGNSPVPVQAIIDECLADQFGAEDRIAKYNLDKRTDLLLDRLG